MSIGRLLQVWQKSGEKVNPPSDWVYPKSTIVIVGAPRSGTSLLCALMEKTEKLGGPDEFFAKRLPKYPDPNGRNDLNHRLSVANSRTTANGICSFKLFISHLQFAEEKINLWEYFRNPVFVRVARDDLLGQSISLARAKQTKQFSSRTSKSGSEPLYSYFDIERAMDAILRQNCEWDKYFAYNELAPVNVLYEDMINDHGSILRTIASRVEVSLDFIPSLDSTGRAKQRDDLSDHWRKLFVVQAKIHNRVSFKQS